MKIRGKNLFWTGLLIVFVILLFFANVNSKNLPNEPNKLKMDRHLIGHLNTEENARVIILLDPRKEKSSKIKQLESQSPENKEGRGIISNTFSKQEIEEFSNDDSVKEIFLDSPVHASLQDSTIIINATKTWSQQIGGINLTGGGETVCVLDTGINYSHGDFGSCNISKLNLNGNITSYTLESAHNYSNNFDYTWKINYSGFTNISVHFKNISLEYLGQDLSCPNGCDSFDRIIIYNSQMKEIASYHGKNTQISDLWTPTSVGDTVFVRLISDEAVTGYGFYIDKILNGTSNYTYDWSTCNKIPYGWDFVNNDGDPRDDYGHGTHVSGIVAANGNIKGVAPDSKIISGKVLDQNGDGWTSNIYFGIEWCINNSQKYNISVISMSLGDPSQQYDNYCNDDPLYGPIQEAVLKNISVVIASGNENNVTGISSPACIENVIPVASTTKADNISSFSDRNWMVRLLAPGSNINSTWIDGKYASMSGTSMATPHVAGTIAIIDQYLKLKGQTKTPQEIEDILNSTGKQIYDSASGRSFSRIDVYAAVRSLCNENLTNTSWQIVGNVSSCRTNDTVLYNFSSLQYDANNCGFTNNLTYSLINESVCDFCIPNWTEISGINLIWYNDTNSCYVRTNLSSDLLSRPINVSLNASANKTDFYNNETNNTLILELNFNYSKYSNNFTNFQILKENSSYNYSWTIVSGLNLSLNDSFAKAIYLNKTLNSGLVCIKDAEIGNILEISQYCNSTSETLFNSCPETIGNYSCEIYSDGRYKISGLKNSGVREQDQFCGDLVCNSSIGETCSSCSNDCGGCPSGSSSSRGGGGGGSGGSILQTYRIANENLSLGVSQKFAMGDKIIFVISGVNHTIETKKINKNNASFVISSEVMNITLNIGEETRLNLTSESYYDLYIKLENISFGKANLTIKKIFETRPEFIQKEKGGQYRVMNETNQSSENTPNNSNNKITRITYVLAVAGVLFIIFFAVVYCLVKKPKNKKRKSK